MTRTFALLLAFAACKGKQVEPLLQVDVAPRLVLLSVEHLQTRTTDTSTNLYFQHFPEGTDAAAVLADVAAGVRVEAVGGEPINASVARMGDHYGDGLTISWDPGLPTGWYRIVIPNRQLPTFVNRQAWSEAESEAAVWFRVGSQPLVRSIVRSRLGSRTFFEIHFSEPVRAETATISDLVELSVGDNRLECAAVQSLASNEPVDLTRLFRSFVLSCEGDGLNVSRVVVKRFKTPEGAAVKTMDGAALSLDWNNAAPLEGGLSEQWFEARLPL